MYFAPQRRAILPHPDFQKWAETVSFLTFSLANVLRATAACHFCHLNFQNSGPRMVENVLGAFFDIPTSKSGPRMVCFVYFDLKMGFAQQRHAIFHFSSEQVTPHPPLLRILFEPPDPQIIRDFPNISRTCIFFLLTFSLSLFCSSFLLFSSLFFISPYCGKFDS